MFRRKDNEPPRPEQNEPLARANLDTKPPVMPSVPKREEPPAPSLASVMAPKVSVPGTDDNTGKRLIVGQGIRLAGEITACDRLVVEGFCEVTLNETRALEIAGSGRFIGGCEVEEAEISGTYEGELTVRKRLLIRSSGKVRGNVRYGEIEIERGGMLSGSVSMIESHAQGSQPSENLPPS
ncbi:MAG TPA: polymer-forming cytoskeletal protein [Geminicoccus sp.]|jgi:cytoskeletal protein CcmA (bactofilin family)|uniref:bactofilin family protein n=1 Tax=Geminicoccus sp. TaxID=2024832 RepID=UPI002E2F2CE0|nr:polymer-forming cytoskeletal protein [Geminicoccus sp.]HEX2525200.1 polymer-forming cytoskeletal protein [Geminicoccus sp.]